MEKATHVHSRNPESRRPKTENQGIKAEPTKESEPFKIA